MNKATIIWLNQLSNDEAREAFRACCGADWWLHRMAESRPFVDAASVLDTAQREFDAMPRDSWLEAFASHPRIGDLESIKLRLEGNRQWSATEQSGVASASDQALQQLAQCNAEYERRFGYPFIVCATGKTADEMLALLRQRLSSAPEAELRIASREQRKITRLRLDKLAPRPIRREPQSGTTT